MMVVTVVDIIDFVSFHCPTLTDMFCSSFGGSRSGTSACKKTYFLEGVSHLK